MTRMSSTGTPKAQPIGSPMQEVLSLLRPLGQKELAPPERTGTTAASTAAKQTDKVGRFSFNNRNFLGQEPALEVNGSYVPYHVFDGDNLKNRNLMFAEKFKSGKKKIAPSSFFPEHWDRVDVLKSVGEAFANKRHIGDGKYRGSSSTGMTIEMYLNKDGTIATAFPIYNK